MPLTNSAIKDACPRDRIYKLSDGGGLSLAIHPSGRKTFQISYRVQGVQRTATLGQYPHLKLTAARSERGRVKTALRRGENPFAPNVREAPVAVEVAAQPWRRYMEDYLEKRRREGAAPATLNKLKLHAEVTCAALAEKDIRTITPKDVIAACRPYEEAGCLNSAHAVRALCSQVFRFAIALGDAEADPAAPTRDAIARPRSAGYAGITDPARIGELMRAIRCCQSEPATSAGLLLSAYLFPRNGELRHMRWDQIKGQFWTIPGTQMKMQREHVVPLPRQALEVLRWIKPITGCEPFVLHSRFSASGLLSENTFNKALRRLGFAPTEHVHHGFRITASTTLHENGWNSDWIERQLAHVEENKIKRAYNKALYLDGRAAMMQWYANWLDTQSGT